MIEFDFPSSPEQFYQGHNGKTHYRYIHCQQESAQTIVMLPGFSIPSSAYYPFAKAISESGFDILIIDYYGRGFSIIDSGIKFEYSIKNFSEQVIELLIALKIDKCVLISFSFGSLIAGNIAAKKPSLITRLVFVSPFHCLQHSLRPFQHYVLTNSILGWFVLKYTARIFIASDIAQQFADINKSSLSYWGAIGACYQQLQHNPSFVYAIATSLSHMADLDLSVEMQKTTRMSVKALVLFGEMDKIVNIDQAENWWTKWMPNVKVSRKENVGHLMFLEDPEEISETIAQFLHR